MIPVINKFLKEQRLKKNLLKFLDEMDKNLELFYVMDQRQFITQRFTHAAWEAVRKEAIVAKYASLAAYASSIEEFNCLFKENKEFEQWYVSDMNNKTPENAKKLHGMKHDLDKKLKSFEGLIILAGQDLEKEMLQLGLLKA